MSLFAVSYAFAAVAIALIVLLATLRLARAGRSSRRLRLFFTGVYVAHFTATVTALRYLGALKGGATSQPLDFLIYGAVTESALSPTGLWLRGDGAATVATQIAELATQHLGFVVGIVSYAVASTALFASRPVRPRFGAEPFFASRSLAAVCLAALLLSRVPGPALGVASWTLAFLGPVFFFEALSIVHRMARGLESRTVLTIGCGLAISTTPRAVGFAILLGAVIHLLQLDRLAAPIASPALQRSRPIRRVAVLLSSGAMALFTLAWLHSEALRAGSAVFGEPPRMCSHVQATRDRGGTRYESPWLNFAMEDTEARLSGASNRHAADTACRERGKRVCTSEEWYLACVCRYPTEAAGGVEYTPNSLLAHRVERERAEGKGIGRARPRGLLEASTELVENGDKSVVLMAGATSAIASEWMTDCRYRTSVHESVLRSSAWSFVAVRCCW